MLEKKLLILKRKAPYFIFCMVLGVLFFNILFTPVKTYANQEEKVLTRINVSNNGTPLIKTSFNALNVEVALQKIKSGEFSQKFLEGGAWKTFLQNAPEWMRVQGNEVTFANGLKFGPGIQLNEKDARTVINSILISNGKPIISELNLETENIPESPVAFYQPGKYTNKFTNQEGVAETFLSKGLTAILDARSNYIKLIDIQNAGQTFTIDLDNTSPDLTFKLESATAKEKTNFGQYVISLDQDLVYHLLIKKELLKSTDSVTLSLPANSQLVIDTVESSNPNVTITPNKLAFDITTANSPTSIVAATIGFADDLNQDLDVVVKGHMNKTLISESNSPNLNLGVKATTNQMGNGVELASTPNLVTSGINFAMIDGQKLSLESGAEYVLGREVEGKKEIYMPSGSWEAVNQLDSDTASKGEILKGGQRYIIASENKEIPLATARFNFDLKQNQEINKSLIQIFGLSKGEKYFLYQTKAAQNYEGNSKINYFNVDYINHVSNNGAFLSESTISNSQVALPTLNGKLPDFSAGVNEYNPLLVSEASLKQTQVMKKFVITLFIFICISIAAVFTVIKFL
ncbi:surface protein [Lactococcus formosensis]|uniref:Surface protein n=1 Tax=Lactococcus formosensis TaxID=1281486 RepID=A0A9X4SFG2_9LACT|nr:surface protein [Lactococcus formosensis]MDG6141873.1 surface protein [Lactococcus formosensis]MDG6156143.1 surface protein [Lactococcus formosensis]MDG6159077.1 surface protein [Lactococcus formosensis]MDG6166682.1 surface protein [Lactococcus formosensis]MDG6171764.1 surface protein [Lactococcus formosensis]